MSIIKRITGVIINTFLFIFLTLSTVFMVASMFILGLIARVYLWVFKPEFVPTDIKTDQPYAPYNQEEVIIFNY